MTSGVFHGLLIVAYLLGTLLLIVWISRGPSVRRPRPAIRVAPEGRSQVEALVPGHALAPAHVRPKVDAEALATGLAGGVAILQVEGWQVLVLRDPFTQAIRHEVSIPGSTGAFQVAAPSCADVLDAFDGAPTTTVLFDGDLRVDGDPRRLAAQGGVLLALRDLVRRPGVVSARLAGGLLTVQEGPSPRVDLDLVVGTVQQAVLVARGCERRVLEVRVRGALVTGLAWTGGAGARCPFCHDGLEGELATCEACRTIHHTDCLADAGCTVLGCRGRERQRT